MVRNPSKASKAAARPRVEPATIRCPSCGQDAPRGPRGHVEDHPSRTGEPTCQGTGRLPDGE